MPDYENDRLRLRAAGPLPPRFASPGSAVMVGRVVTAAPAVGKFLLVHPVSVSGDEVEAAPGLTGADTTVTVPVYLVGPGVPATGDLLVCRFVDYRWVAERSSGANRDAANPCKCTWPRVLTYLGSVKQAQSAFYFLNIPASEPEPPYTLTYGPRPADVPKNLQLLFFSAPGGVHDPWYVTMPETAWFSPPVPVTIFGVVTHMYFYLWIQSCRASVMVIDAPYGVNAYGNGEDSATKGAGNYVYSYVQSRCMPRFEMSYDLTHPPQITGTHGADDLAPGATASAGVYTNPRIGL